MPTSRITVLFGRSITLTTRAKPVTQEPDWPRSGPDNKPQTLRTGSPSRDLICVLHREDPKLHISVICFHNVSNWILKWPIKARFNSYLSSFRLFVAMINFCSLVCHVSEPRNFLPANHQCSSHRIANIRLGIYYIIPGLSRVSILFLLLLYIKKNYLYLDSWIFQIIVSHDGHEFDNLRPQ